MITIIDYGMGNIGSIANMFRKVGAQARLSSDPDEIAQATKLILPGVGAFDIGMRNLAERHLLPVLNQKALQEKVPVLGICLGMQLLTRGSEEGQLAGLNWVAAETKRFRLPSTTERPLKVPHMGWNSVRVVQQCPLFADMDQMPKFYFVHSYHVVCDCPEDALTRTTYGYEFISAIRRDNIMGVQFHPEKSHRYGMDLLKRFAEL